MKDQEIKNEDIQVPTKDQLDKTEVLDIKLQLVDTVPGFVAELDPDEADLIGAFEETAISFEDAIEASTDPREA